MDEATNDSADAPAEDTAVPGAAADSAEAAGPLPEAPSIVAEKESEEEAGGVPAAEGAEEGPAEGPAAGPAEANESPGGEGSEPSPLDAGTADAGAPGTDGDVGQDVVGAEEASVEPEVADAEAGVVEAEAEAPSEATATEISSEAPGEAAAEGASLPDATMPPSRDRRGETPMSDEPDEPDEAGEVDEAGERDEAGELDEAGEVDEAGGGADEAGGADDSEAAIAQTSDAGETAGAGAGADVVSGDEVPTGKGRPRPSPKTGGKSHPQGMADLVMEQMLKVLSKNVLKLGEVFRGCALPVPSPTDPTNERTPPSPRARSMRQPWRAPFVSGE